MEISPRYQMKLVAEVEKTLWAEFTHEKYKNVKRYIEKWHETSEWNNYENFPIVYQEDGRTIDLGETLHGIEAEMILKIAIDLGIETPDFIASIPVFRNELKEKYKRAHDSFGEAIKNVLEQPNVSVGLANSTLESIIKYILEDKLVSIEWSERDTLYKLTESVLKEFGLFPGPGQPEEIRNIGSSLLKVSKQIEALRSDKTLLHGKTDNSYMLEDSLYASFVVNSVATVGMFLLSYYEKKYKNAIAKEEILVIDLDAEIPTIDLD